MPTRPESYPTPTWKVPEPLGHPGAVTAAGSVAAPLLVGFSVTLIGLVIGQGPRIRWPGLALDLLALAVILLLGSVQCAFMARRYAVSPSEIEDWWPDHADDRRRSELREDQAQYFEDFLRWAERFRRAYNLGVLLLLAAVAVVLAPPNDQHEVARWIAVASLAQASSRSCGGPWVPGRKASVRRGGPDNLTHVTGRSRREPDAHAPLPCWSNAGYPTDWLLGHVTPLPR